MLAKMVLWNTEIVGDSQVMQMRKKKNYHSESVFMCTKKEQSNFEYKGGSEPFWPGHQGRVPGNQGRVSGREDVCGGHTGLVYENVREKESHVAITAFLDYLLH